MNPLHPFISDSSLDPIDIATDGVVELLRFGGVEVVSLSAVARWASRTRSSMHQRHGSSERFVVDVVARFGRRWTEWVVGTSRDAVNPIRLPRDPNEVDGVRAWQAIRMVAEGARRAGRPQASVFVEDALAAERRHIADHLARRLGRTVLAREVEYLVVLAEGLRSRIVAREAALAPGEADLMLRHHFYDVLGLDLGPADLSIAECALLERAWRDRPAI
ncbi:MAG: hypothetical protein FWD95_13265 [Nocardioidaceae bacterium]|nr:hypothetical protein [Nocardioidaceae bacterium]